MACMSINITPAQVTAVQLVDGWHEARPGSFRLSSITFGAPGSVEEMMGVGRGDGFTLATPGGDNISGPIASILAVRH
jgi:hypothetical protein